MQPSQYITHPYLYGLPPGCWDPLSRAIPRLGVRSSYSHGEDCHWTFLYSRLGKITYQSASFSPMAFPHRVDWLIRPPPQNSDLFLAPPGSQSGVTSEVTSLPSQSSGQIAPYLLAETGLLSATSDSLPGPGCGLSPQASSREYSTTSCC